MQKMNRTQKDVLHGNLQQILRLSRTLMLPVCFFSIFLVLGSMSQCCFAGWSVSPSVTYTAATDDLDGGAGYIGWYVHSTSSVDTPTADEFGVSVGGVEANIDTAIETTAPYGDVLEVGTLNAYADARDTITWTGAPGTSPSVTFSMAFDFTGSVGVLGEPHMDLAVDSSSCDAGAELWHTFEITDYQDTDDEGNFDHMCEMSGGAIGAGGFAQTYNNGESGLGNGLYFNQIVTDEPYDQGYGYGYYYYAGIDYEIALDQGDYTTAGASHFYVQWHAEADAWADCMTSGDAFVYSNAWADLGGGGSITWDLGE